MLQKHALTKFPIQPFPANILPLTAHPKGRGRDSNRIPGNHSDGREKRVRCVSVREARLRLGHLCRDRKGGKEPRVIRAFQAEGTVGAKGIAVAKAGR